MCGIVWQEMENGAELWWIGVVLAHIMGTNANVIYYHCLMSLWGLWGWHYFILVYLCLLGLISILWSCQQVRSYVLVSWGLTCSVFPIWTDAEVNLSPMWMSCDLTRGHLSTPEKPEKSSAGGHENTVYSTT